MKKRLCILIALILLSGLISFPSPARAEETSVRVLLSTEGRDTLTLGLSGAYDLNGVEINGGTLIVAVSGVEVVVSHSELGPLFTGEKATLTNAGRENLFTLATAGGKERSYRGSVTFDVSNGAVRAVNAVAMEDYLVGVAVPEVGKDSAEAVLKAGMLAAKGYALAEIGVSGSKAYDVDDTTSDQLYYGYFPDAARVLSCAAAVADQTLLYHGKAIKTHYGSSNGGVMVTPKDKWGGSQEYNGAYACRFDPFDITRSGVSNLMIAVTGNVPGTLPQKLYDYLLSKTGADAIVQITDVTGYENGGHSDGYAPQDGFRITMKVSGGGSETTQTLDVTFNELSKNNVVLSDNSVRFAAKVKDGQWLLCWGQSSGPRVGMSHKGAQRMAEMGYSYVDILKFYYPNAELTRSDGTIIDSSANLSTAAVMAALGGSQNNRITKTMWVAVDGAEIMSKASANSDVCARLPFRSQFGVYEASGDWYYGIDLATGVQGFILKKSLSAEEPTATPEPTPTPTPTPEEPTPTPEATPVPTPETTEGPTAGPGGEPEPSGTPEASESPNPSGTPEASESPNPSGTPEASESPEPSATPEVSESPEPSATPETSESPEPSATPEASESPEPSATPEASESPEPSETPEPTETPAPTDTPEPTETPAPTDTPEPTETPAPTDTPKPTNTPKPTKKPTDEPSIRLSKGDVNGDQLISAADAALILRYSVGLVDLEDYQLEAADMDGDGQVTQLDAKLLLQSVAKKLL